MDGTDVMKSGTFSAHKSHWWPIRAKVAAWIKEGWATWEEEKPDWFTDQWKASIPEDMKLLSSRVVVDVETAAEAEGDEALTEGVEEQKGPLKSPQWTPPRPQSLRSPQAQARRSVLEFISKQKRTTSKVTPEGTKVEVDEDEFVRQMNRRGSMRM